MVSVLKKSDLVTKLAEANTEFGLNVYKHLPGIEQGGNLFFSPFSVSTVLTMVYMGAKGNTEQEMETVMNLRLIRDDVHQAYKEHLRLLNTRNKKYSLYNANRVYFYQKAKLLKQFRSNCLKFYNTKLFAVDFGTKTETIRQIINKWVKDQTDGKIRNTMAENVFNAMTRMILVNAIYFKGEWEIKFDSELTKKMPFYTTQSEYVDVDMMTQEEYLRHGIMKELGFTFLELPYKWDDLSMIILLPDKREGLSALEEVLAPDTLLSIPQSFRYHQEIKVIIPKFRINASFDLDETLSVMGMKDLFNNGDANLPAIDKMNSIHVSKLAHAACIDVNEKGTKATSATVGITECRRTTPAKEFIVDHPFMFLIHDNQSGSILFMGRLTEPNVDQYSLGDKELKSSSSAIRNIFCCR